MTSFEINTDWDEASSLPPGEQAPALEVLCAPELWGRIPAPERAVRFAPKWFKRLKPEAVTPAVLYLVSEDAPNGTIVEAGAGYYSKVQIVEGKGVKLGDNVTVEDIAKNWDKISDMSAAAPYNNGSEVTIKIFSP